MRYFFDTEFNEDGKTIELISIGMVAEDGRELYCVSSEFDPARCNPWVQQHVLPKLPHPSLWMPRSIIAALVLEFVGGGDASRPEFWAYYADYDWVALCQLYGPMIDLPLGWPMYCRDIKQLTDSLGNPPLPEQGKGEHDALQDARWNASTWRWLHEQQIPLPTGAA